jgi:hypothetical protein
MSLMRMLLGGPRATLKLQAASEFHTWMARRLLNRLPSAAEKSRLPFPLIRTRDALAA